MIQKEQITSAKYMQLCLDRTRDQKKEKENLRKLFIEAWLAHNFYALIASTPFLKDSLKTCSLGKDSNKLAFCDSLLTESDQREEAQWRDIVGSFGVYTSAKHTDTVQVLAFLSFWPPAILSS